MSKGRAKTARIIRTTEKAERAAELSNQGWTLAMIAKELGYASSSGVANLLERHLANMPRVELEKRRDTLIARLELLWRMALKDAQSKDPRVRDEAQKRMLRAVDSLARVTGVVKVLAPMVQVNVGAKEAELDLSKLSVEEVMNLRAYRMKMLGEGEPAPAKTVIETEGTEVTDGEREDSGEGGGGLGNRS